MSAAARVEAQAKVNAFLIVSERRPDGFHDIETLFHRIDLADQITVRVGGSARSLDVTGPAIPPSGLGPIERNLAYRAAESFGKRIGGEFGRGFSIELTKNIPVGAGLGGGSADAGAVLRALNTLAGKPLTTEDLIELASTLGSDVPFFASEYVRAEGYGRGEQLHDHSAFPEWWEENWEPREMVTLVPPFATATADAYRWLDEDRKAGLASPPLELPSSGGLVQSTSWWRYFRENIGNSFESVLEARHPELRDLRRRLDAAGAETAMLAGSGSCVFGVFRQDVPRPSDLGSHARVIHTRASSRVVQVEVLQ